GVAVAALPMPVAGFLLVALRAVRGVTVFFVALFVARVVAGFVAAFLPTRGAVFLVADFLPVPVAGFAGDSVAFFVPFVLLVFAAFFATRFEAAAVGAVWPGLAPPSCRPTSRSRVSKRRR